MATQYRIIESAAGRADRRARGRLRFDGADARRFLHALVSNDVESLTRGRGVYVAWLTPQGRMIADLRLFDRGDGLLAEVPAGLGAALADRLDQLIFTEDVRVSDVTAATAVVRIAGARASAVISAWLGVDTSAVAALAPLAQLDVPDGRESPVDFIVRADDSEAPAFDVWMPAAGWAAADAALDRLDVPVLDDGTIDALRIIAGRPEFGVDMTEETIPLEAGLLDRAISTSKGCYVGQEVIIRVLHRGGGRVAKRLMLLAFGAADGDALPSSGAPLMSEGREAGHLTSVAWSPRDGRAMALGYLKRDVADAGSPVDVMLPDGPRRADVIRAAG